MGNKLSLVIVVAVVLGIVGIGGYLLMKGGSQSASTGTPDMTADGTPGTDNPGAGNVTIAREITVTASEFKFVPSEVRVKKGETVKITLKNTGAMPHNWMVEGMGGASIETTDAGSSTSITLTPSQTGTFTTFCNIGQHRKLGMEGKLIVE